MIITALSVKGNHSESGRREMSVMLVRSYKRRRAYVLVTSTIFPYLKVTVEQNIKIFEIKGRKEGSRLLPQVRPSLLGG